MRGCFAFALSLAFLAGVTPLAACRHGTDPTALDARTLRPAAEESALPMRATYFPPTVPRAGRRDVPLVVVEPFFFRRELLYAKDRGNAGDARLVPYLQDAGFPVWLVWVDATSPPESRALGRGIARTVTSIATETGARVFDLVGLSMGADGALRALDLMTSPGSPVAIRRVAFVGGGFDFAYPHSFAARTADLRGGAATRICSIDGDTGCARDFRRPEEAVRWLGALPPAEDDALRPAMERFPFVTRFAHLPVLFVNGKADGIAPSESSFPVYALWGSDAPDPRGVPKLIFLAGRENKLGEDLDHFGLLAGSHAEDVWSRVVAWLARD